jgi:uncharacterized DUF497 family protein
MAGEVFEWDSEKAAINLRKHGVSFPQARVVFQDAFATLDLDSGSDRGEERYIIVGMAEQRLLTVVYTERQDRIRLISARGATSRERHEYYRNQTPA